MGDMIPISYLFSDPIAPAGIMSVIIPGNKWEIGIMSRILAGVGVEVEVR